MILLPGSRSLIGVRVKHSQTVGLVVANNVHLIYKLVVYFPRILYLTLLNYLNSMYNIGLAISLYIMNIDYICFSVYDIYSYSGLTV